MPSIREIAKQAGVSITTVSRVLNNHPNVSVDARDQVMAAANKTRYVASVGRRSTNNVALVYTGERSLGSPFDAALLQGLGDALDDSEFDLLILDAARARQQGETFSNMFMRKGVRGAILRATYESRAICESIAGEGFPVVVIGERFEGGKIPVIYSDSRDASREAVSHLIHLGHTRIAMCVNIVDDSDHMDRVAGYQAALEANGLPYDEKLVWRIPAVAQGGAQVIKRVLMMPDRPSAVYITDPLTCVRALAEAHRVGMKIPSELSVVGFDDGDMRTHMIPQMTAVCQDASALGREAFKMLEKLIAEGRLESAVPKSLNCWFELHDTTGVPSVATAATYAVGDGSRQKTPSL